MLDAAGVISTGIIAIQPLGELKLTSKTQSSICSHLPWQQQQYVVEDYYVTRVRVNEYVSTTQQKKERKDEES